ncbi:MAG: DUF72 domain-containing protein [Planctomycetota bacterium]
MIRVGPAGWSYPDWEGPVYPRPKPRGFHPLAFLSRFVNTIEINSSFYGVPKRENSMHWAELIAHLPEFRFTAKLHQDFTHSARPLADLASEVGEFHAGFEPLIQAGRLSALLAQFPLGFRFEPAGAARLSELCSVFARVPLVVELRHASWYEPPGIDLIEQLGCSLAAIDLPEAANHPPAVHPTPGPIGYLRLHGRNAAAWFARDSGRDEKYDYLYTTAEIATLADRARRLAGQHDETFVVTNNHFEGKAVANALELLANLTGARVPAPRSLALRYPELQALTKSEGQAELFS